MTFKTEQEAFWAGDFDTEYIQRSQGDALLASNLNFFAKALHQARGVKSCIEFGANIGMRPLRTVVTTIACSSATLRVRSWTVIPNCN